MRQLNDNDFSKSKSCFIEVSLFKKKTSFMGEKNCCKVSMSWINEIENVHAGFISGSSY